MKLVQAVDESYERMIESARLRGIEAASAASAGSSLLGLMKAFYTTIPQIQARDPCYGGYNYSERVAFNVGLLEGLKIDH